MFENKTVNYILERAKIAEREVTAEELMKEAEAETAGEEAAPAKKEKKSRTKSAKSKSE